MTDPIIEIQNIGKKYTLGGKEPYYSLRDKIMDFLGGQEIQREEFWALRNVTFNVNQGEVVGIVGRNGAGKSTLLKILSRITPPTEGTIKMRGRVASLLEVGTGFNPELSGRENIYLNGSILGMSRKEIEAKFKLIVEFSEIGKFLDMPVKRYSSGMYVRLAFSVAAHLDPEILVVDEVLAVGDSAFQKKCLRTMDDAAKGGRTVLFVSHNMGAVKKHCGRAVLLEKGEVQMVGDTEEVINRYLSSHGGQTELLLESKKDDSKKVQIRKISIYNSNKVHALEMDICQPFFVEIEYDINENLNLNNSLDITFMDLHNNVLFRTCDIDSDDQYYKYRPKGKYISTFAFPGNFLNQQQYKLRISCGVPVKHSFVENKEAFYDCKEDIIVSFFDSNSFTKKFYKGIRSGSFLLHIPCVTKSH